MSHTLVRKAKYHLDERTCYRRCGNRDSGLATGRDDGSPTCKATLVTAQDANGGLIPAPVEAISRSSAVINPRTAPLDDDGSGVLGVIACIRAPRDSVACTMAEGPSAACTGAHLHMRARASFASTATQSDEARNCSPAANQPSARNPIRTSSCSKPTSCCG
jgi:hypothetical protein